MDDSRNGRRRGPVTGETYRPMHEPRYMDIATFMRAPLAENLTDLDIALVGGAL